MALPESEERERLKHGLRECNVPQGLHNGLLEYIIDGRPTGDFLAAILRNDLKDACGRADLENQTRLFDIVFFLYNWCPSSSWGSPERHERWLAERGMKGLGIVQ